MVTNQYTRWVQDNKHYFTIVNQNPTIAGVNRMAAEVNYLPALIFLWHLVEQ